MASQGTLNKVMLIGHTGDDVKVHYFDNGGVIGNFPLATNESYINKRTGERVTNVEWHTIVVRNKAAEICEKYLKKGDKVFIEGRLKTRKWQDANGVERYTTEVHCTDFTFLSPKEQGGNTQESSGNKKVSKPVDNTKTNPTSTPDYNDQEEEDDLPF